MKDSKPDILIIHTGGTLGMDLSGEPGDESTFKDTLKSHAPRIFEVANIAVEILYNKDSSNMTPGDWAALATALDAHMDNYDAFIVIHGTDTMAFTASALSFMLQNPKKPIILTGSQRPLMDARSDAPRNLIYAVELATRSPFKEVCIFFDSVLLRGNRAKKVSIPSFGAFDSPNFPPLAKAGVSTEFIPLVEQHGEYRFNPKVDPSVVNISLFPGAKIPDINFFLQNQAKALVLQAFGPGDIPTSSSNVMTLLDELKNHKIPVVICSQAITGRVNPELYDAGRKALAAGAISASDMTWESAITKCMCLLGQKLSYEDFKTAFARNLAGEITDEKFAHHI